MAASFLTHRVAPLPGPRSVDQGAAVNPDHLYHESATYTRLGELTLEWTPAWRRGARSSGLTVAVEARNVLTWTGFGGPNPEVATTRSALPSTWGLATLPALPRTIGVRVELGTR